MYNPRNEVWTNIDKECYQRNCICEGCFYNQYSTKCKAKFALIDKIKTYGLDTKVETKKWLQT